MHVEIVAVVVAKVVAVVVKEVVVMVVGAKVGVTIEGFNMFLLFYSLIKK